MLLRIFWVLAFLSFLIQFGPLVGCRLENPKSRSTLAKSFAGRRKQTT